MATPDVAAARALLAERLADVDEQLVTLQASYDDIVAAATDANTDDEHDPEGATIAFERQQVAALLAAARERRDRLREALAALDSGGYGTCERCGEPIAAERLAALPGTRTCIRCAGRR